MPYLTFVTPKPEKDFDIWIKKSHPEIAIENREVFDDTAVRWKLQNIPRKDVIDQIRQEFKVDIFVTDGVPPKLFMADMDSTIVMGETLDDMADIAGIGDKIADITARAMAGELDFKAALRERVAMLSGHPAALIDLALEHMKYNKGAKELLTALKSKGVYCVLVSGGFTQFTSFVADDLGFDHHFGNELIIAPKHDGHNLPFLGQGSVFANSPNDLILTGEVAEPILDKDFKLNKLNELQSSVALKPSEMIAIGDGANDLPMLGAAGIGISYYGKPVLRDILINQINYTDLRSLRYLL
jgi:phosphoserine phosphatase